MLGIALWRGSCYDNGFVREGLREDLIFWSSHRSLRMDAQATGGFLRFFGEIPDPRAANVVHKLCDLFAIAICAVICGADSWVDVAMFGASKGAWLSTFMDLEHGVPSHDTFGRV